MYTDIHPYTGNEPFIFISYAHKDEKLVMSTIQWLNDNHYRVWFDKGIHSGEFASKIAERLENSSCVIALLSDNFVDSINCRNEINYAINHKKTILPIYMKPTELRNGMGLQLVSYHFIYRYQLDEKQFYEQLIQSSEIQKAHIESSANHLKYTAFICYRHSPLDIRVAKELQKKIERYHIPKGLQMEDRSSLGPVFLDQSELPLNSNLEETTHKALDQSQYLIVVCTPETPKSKWIAHNIQYFIEKHGRQRILTILAAGTPEDSIPKIITHTYDTDGETVLQKTEPVCISLGGENEKKVLKNLKKEFPRLIAVLLDGRYNDFAQRQKRALFQKHVIRTFLSCLLICILCLIGNLIHNRLEKSSSEEHFDSTPQNQMNIRNEYSHLTAYDEEIIVATTVKTWKPLSHLGYDVTISEVLSQYYSNVKYEKNTVTAQNDEESIQFSVWWRINADGSYSVDDYYDNIFYDCYINGNNVDANEFEKYLCSLITGVA